MADLLVGFHYIL